MGRKEKPQLLLSARHSVEYILYIFHLHDVYFTHTHTCMNIINFHGLSYVDNFYSCKEVKIVPSTKKALSEY